jgi:glycosidase
MYDVLRDITCHRRGTGDITQAWQHTDDIRQHMLYFLENHDEQRIASKFFAGDARKALPAFIVAALLEKNPLMIYAGQEYGEKGMDCEGFSGIDGRTTIFDYWNVDTLTRAAERRLTADEQALADFYYKVMTIARNETAVSKGMMFDLTYANRHYGAQYAFLRQDAKNSLLVVVNFDDCPCEMQLAVPEHAFDYLSLKEKNYTATDLLTGEKHSLMLTSKKAVPLTVPSRGGLVLKF